MILCETKFPFYNSFFELSFEIYGIVFLSTGVVESFAYFCKTITKRLRGAVCDGAETLTLSNLNLYT